MSDKNQRLKSPPYPAFDLERSLERASELRTVAKGFGVPIPSAAEAWGYSAKSSSIPSVIGALNQFGLLEESGSGETRRLQVSSLGDKILMDKRPDSRERALALREAALSPKVFQELWDQFGTPDVDEGTIVYELTLGRKSVGRAPYSEAAASEVAKKFKSSLIFAGFDADEVESELVDSGEVSHSDAPSAEHTRHDAPKSENLVVHSGSGDTFEERKALDEGAAVLVWPKKLSADSVEDMEYWLKGVLRQIKRRVGREVEERKEDLEAD